VELKHMNTGFDDSKVVILIWKAIRKAI